MADNEGEGDHTPVSTDKEKKVEKKRRGISTGFRCSIFPLKIQNPSSSTTGSSLSHSKELSVGLADECFTVAESWLATILFSLGYQEIDGIIDDHNADTPSGKEHLRDSFLSLL